MTQQLNFYGFPFHAEQSQTETAAYARQRDPETSYEAAQSIRATDLELTVLDALKARGTLGATTHELAELLELDLVTVSPRLRPLSRKGLVEPTNNRRCGHSGRKSIVWRAR